MSGDSKHVGATIGLPGGRLGKIVICSDLLDMAVVAELDASGNENGKHGVLKPSRLIPPDKLAGVTAEDIPY